MGGICLSDDPFAGDYGGAGGGDRVLSDKMVTNRKGGVCHMCAGSARLELAIVSVPKFMTASLCASGGASSAALRWPRTIWDGSV